MEVGGGGTPEPEVRHLHGRAEVAERGLDFVPSVEDERRVEVARREVHGLDLHRARLVVSRAHEEPAVVERKAHAMVEAAVEVEVVVRKRELLRGPFEHVVECGEKSMRAGGERTGRNLQTSPRERLDAARRPAVHDDPRVLHRLGERERAAVETRPALAEPFRLHVPAAWHGHPVCRREIGSASLLQRLPLREGELPATVQVKRFLPRPCGSRQRKRKEDDTSLADKCFYFLLHGALLYYISHFPANSSLIRPPTCGDCPLRFPPLRFPLLSDFPSSFVYHSASRQIPAERARTGL